MKARESIDTLDKGTEALIFAIYFAAVTSMPEGDVERRFGANKKAVTTKYRVTVEQALMSAGFLNAQDITTLQAFIIFLACVQTTQN